MEPVAPVTPSPVDVSFIYGARIWGVAHLAIVFFTFVLLFFLGRAGGAKTPIRANWPIPVPLMREVIPLRLQSCAPFAKTPSRAVRCKSFTADTPVLRP